MLEKIARQQVDRRRFLRLAGATGSALWLPTALAGESGMLLGFRQVQHDNVHLYFDLAGKPADTRLFTLSEPERLVIDLHGIQVSDQLQPASYPTGVVKAIRFAVHDGGQRLRIAVDLRRQTEPAYQFVPRQDGQRLVIDLGVKGSPLLSQGSSHIIERAPATDVVIAIDAGHGGKDPGAVGSRKTLEKNVALQIGRMVEHRLASQPGVRVRMTRSDDRYVPLRERIRMARDSGAHAFVSLHADAAPRRSARGSSVYALSLKGASSEMAAQLAEHENKIDLMLNPELDGRSQDVKQALLQLAQNNSIEASLDMGDRLLYQMKRVGDVHKPSVEQANFAVLKSPAIPSVLVETAFISNPQEEKKLRNKRFQQRMAAAVSAGVMDYMQQRPPAGTHMALSRG